ncbi:MAG: selenium cofactor biosynthesis protein YqeC [Thermodesulfobacteriota bacterium]
MERAAVEPGAALGLENREHLVIVGGGGKTSLLLSLTRELNRAGYRVTATTTTKVWHGEAVDAGRLILTGDKEWPDRLRRGLDSGNVIFLGRRLLPTGKVDGIDPELADELFVSGETDFLIVEGDGAAGRPLKAPDPGEPVVPGSATRVVAMAGLEALGKPMGSDLVFRMERFRKITGAEPGAILSSRAISLLFGRPDGFFRGSPEGARLTAFLNKLDLAGDPGRAHDLALEILQGALPRLSEVVLGSLLQDRYLTVTRT